MRTGGRGYPQVGPRDPALAENSEATVVDVRGEPIYDDVVRVGEPVLSLTDLIRDDEGSPHGLRGWRLA